MLIKAVNNQPKIRQVPMQRHSDTIDDYFCAKKGSYLGSVKEQGQPYSEVVDTLKTVSSHLRPDQLAKTRHESRIEIMKVELNLRNMVKMGNNKSIKGLPTSSSI
ncbi:hypothetical protein ACJJTC_000867 [Scirpophaga incertulas]